MKTILLLALAFSPAVSSHVALTLTECVELIAEDHTLLFRGTVAAATKNLVPTIVLDSIVEGRHGGKLWVLQKTGFSWGSLGGNVFFFPQGDPRWFIQLMGEPAAAFFGFRMLDKNRMTVPDAAEFNGAVAKLSTYMRYDLQPYLHLYESGRTHFVRAPEFNANFVSTDALPLVSDLISRVHRLAFHVTAFFLPQQAFNDFEFFTNEVTVAQSAFRDYLLSQLPAGDPEMSRAVDLIVEKAQFYPALQVAMGTGRLGVGLVRYLEESADGVDTKSFRDGVLRIPYRRLGGRPAIDWKDPLVRPLRSISRRITPDSPAVGVYQAIYMAAHLEERLALMEITSYQRHADTRTLPLIALPGLRDYRRSRDMLLERQPKIFNKRNLNRFFSRYFANRFRMSPRLLEHTHYSDEEICELMAKRLVAIRKTAAALLDD